MFRVSAGFGGIVFALVYAEVLLLLGVLGRTLCWRNANALLMRGARRGACLRKELGGAALVRGLLIFQSCQTAADKVAKSEAAAVADGAHMVGVGAVEHAS